MHMRFEPRFYKILIVIVAVVLCVCIAGSVSRLRYADQELATANAQRRDMQERIVILQDQLSYTQTDEYVAKVARNELNMLLPGEILYVESGK